MRQGGGAEEKAVSGGGIEGELGEGLSGLWRTCGNVTLFRYLGRVMMVGDDDWPEVVVNLQKARNSCGRLSRILSREGAYPKVSGHFSRR